MYFTIGSTCNVMALYPLYNNYKYSKEGGVLDSFPLQQAPTSTHCIEVCLTLSELQHAFTCSNTSSFVYKQQHDGHELFMFLVE